MLAPPKPTCPCDDRRVHFQDRFDGSINRHGMDTDRPFGCRVLRTDIVNMARCKREAAPTDRCGDRHGES